MLFKMNWTCDLKSVVKKKCIFSIHNEKNVFDNIFQIDILEFRNMKLVIFFFFLKRCHRYCGLWLHIRGQHTQHQVGQSSLHRVGQSVGLYCWNNHSNNAYFIISNNNSYRWLTKHRFQRGAYLFGCLNTKQHYSNWATKQVLMSGLFWAFI